MSALYHLQELSVLIIHKLWGMPTVCQTHLLLVVEEAHDGDIGRFEAERLWVLTPLIHHIYLRSEDSTAALSHLLRHTNLHYEQKMAILVL